jgi:hypothetical protein
MPLNVEFEEIAEMIRNDQNLPYTITVEKVEGNVVWTHNQWGNSVKYIDNTDGTYKLKDSE